jgi:anti-sigma factor RsiW
MSDERHQELRLLVQADSDGELAARDAAAVAAHLADCAECRALQRRLRETKHGIATEASYHLAPEDLRRCVTAAIAEQVPMLPPSPLPRRSWKWAWSGGSLGAGALVAASLLLLLATPRDDKIDGAVIDSHVRALQPGHLLDVPSSNQHTVKPWFDGRLDFAPPVKDLAGEGFPLQGGRLDYVAGRAAAALVYGRAQHVIELFVWPSANGVETAPREAIRNGYNLIHWSNGQMNFWAVSDLNSDELGAFVRDWRAAQ